MKNTRTLIVAYVLFLLVAIGVGLRLHGIGHDANEMLKPEAGVLARDNLLLDTDDTQWQMTAERGLATGAWRVKTVIDDNLPFGRASHWPSPFLWMLMLGGKIGMDAGLPISEAVYRGGAWVNPAIVFFFVAAFGWFALRRFGVVGAALICFGLVFTFRGSFDFLGWRTDHHGLIHAVLMVFLTTGCLLFQDKSRWVLWGASLSAAAAVWLGPMNALPVIAAWGFAGLIILYISPVSAWLPARWLRWGLIAGCASFVVTLVEYFPGPPPLNLEVNNWMFAGGFCGAGLLMFALSKSRLHGTLFCDPNHRRAYMGGVTLVSLPVFAIIIGGPGVLAALSPVFGSVMLTITECRPLDIAKMDATLPIVLCAGIGAAVVWAYRRKMPTSSICAAIVLPLAIFMSFLYSRFEPVMLLASFLMLAFVARDAATIKLGYLRILRAAGGFLLLWSAVLTMGQYQSLTIVAGKGWIDSQIAQRELAGKLLRDFKENGEKPFVIAAPADISTRLAYHSGAATVCRIYWECANGIERYIGAVVSSDIQDLANMLELSMATHLLVPSPGLGGDNLLAAVIGPSAYVKNYDTNINRICNSKTRPEWLVPIDGIGDADGKVVLPGKTYYAFRVLRGKLPKPDASPQD